MELNARVRANLSGASELQRRNHFVARAMGGGTGKVEVFDYSGGSFAAISASNYLVDPAPTTRELVTGWPKLAPGFGEATGGRRTSGTRCGKVEHSSG